MRQKRAIEFLTACKNEFTKLVKQDPAYKMTEIFQSAGLPLIQPTGNSVSPQSDPSELISRIEEPQLDTSQIERDKEAEMLRKVEEQSRLEHE